MNESIQQFGQAERQLLESTLSKLDWVNPNPGTYYRFSHTTYSERGQVSRHTSGESNSQSILNAQEGVSIAKSSDEDFTISKSDLPDNLARIFVNGDLITFVYFDARVTMKPRACLQENEIKLVDKIKQDVIEAEQQFNEKMQAFQNNMDKNMQQLQLNMQNMQNQMSNMFGKFMFIDERSYQLCQVSDDNNVT